ncbi:MAG: hypothetical protein GY903_06340 [Fuerstiella sp.]|nr:hypothetical protein [Fuerstiella sp.]MCP4854095.1 hypothetical protein [Fuerstiella sp.]
MKNLWKDECGVILSAEIVLIATILVIEMIVGLVELQVGVVGELSDLGDAIGNLDQGYVASGLVSFKRSHHSIKGRTSGSRFYDHADECDCSPIVICSSDNSRGEKW